VITVMVRGAKSFLSKQTPLSGKLYTLTDLKQRSHDWHIWKTSVNRQVVGTIHLPMWIPPAASENNGNPSPCNVYWMLLIDLCQHWRETTLFVATLNKDCPQADLFFAKKFLQKLLYTVTIKFSTPVSLTSSSMCRCINELVLSNFRRNVVP
jgi:hypothetical protein